MHPHKTQEDKSPHTDTHQRISSCPGACAGLCAVCSMRTRFWHAPSTAGRRTIAGSALHATSWATARLRRQRRTSQVSQRLLANLPQPYTHTSHNTHNTHTAQALTPAESVSSSSQPVSSPSLTPPLPAHIPFRVPRAAARGGGGREVSAEGCGNSPSQGHLQLRVLLFGTGVLHEAKHIDMPDCVHAAVMRFFRASSVRT